MVSKRQRDLPCENERGCCKTGKRDVQKIQVNMYKFADTHLTSDMAVGVGGGDHTKQPERITPFSYTQCPLMPRSSHASLAWRYRMLFRR